MIELIVGTANFGNAYKAAGKSTTLSTQEIKKILTYCYNNNIARFDTAQSYGDSECILGESVKTFMRIATKIYGLGDHNYSEFEFNNRVHDSCRKLNLETIDCLYFHRSNELNTSNKYYYQLLEDLGELKKSGTINKIGISIYQPNDLDEIDLNIIDEIQFPCNVIDGRWCGVFDKKFKNHYQDIHLSARSVFLNGLLLNPQALVQKFKNRKDHFERLFSYCGLKTLEDRINYCVGALNNIHYIDSIVVGIESTEQLSMVHKSMSANPTLYKEFFLTDDKILDARLWN